MAPSPPWQPQRIGLIGGGGKMGRMLAPLLAAQGYGVEVAGPEQGPGYEALLAECQVVIVTVPILETLGVIRSIAPRLKPGQLLSDFTSIKREPVQAMLASPAWVIGCHPLFGPMPNPAGQNVVLCPARPGPCLEWYQDLIRRMGMQPVVMTPQAHDEAMAFIQGLTHFLNIVFARTLQTRQADLQALLQVCSPVYRVFFAVLSRILSGDAQLYGQIQIMNRENIPVLREFLANGQELLGAVEERKWEEFYQVFNSSAAYLGEFRDAARRESDYLIEHMRRYLEAHPPHDPGASEAPPPARGNPGEN